MAATEYAGHSKAVDDGFDRADIMRRTKAILIGSTGNLIEWYDVYVFSAFQLYFAQNFFANVGKAEQQLFASIVFALGFVARPFGSVFFGWMADRYGRRGALTFSVLLMCFGSLVIALTPSAENIGLWSPALLTFARLVQGLSQGGEYGSSSTYLSEMSHPNRRGFYSGVWYMTLIGGQLLAIVTLLILQSFFLTLDEIKAWGWRVPFLIGALLAIVAFILRRDMHETGHFEEAKKLTGELSSFGQLVHHWKALLLVIGVTVGGTSAFYTYTTYMQKFLKQSVGLSDGATTLVTAGSLIFAVLAQPVYGLISDHIGRKPLLLWFGFLGTLLTYPLLVTLHDTKSALTAFLLVCGGWAIVSGYTSITAVVKTEMFPTSVRAMGVGIPYAITAAVFGGSVDGVAQSFKIAGWEEGFYWYATALIFVSLLVYLWLPDTRKHSKMEQHV
jgi:MFS transporter, MHS family, alpha-ketoglutarate permease